MKITSFIFTAFYCNPVSFYLPNEHPKAFLHNKTITMNPNTDIYNKDVHKVDLRKDVDKWIFEPEVPLKFLINKEDSKLVHDPRNSVFEIEFKYEMDFNNTKEDRRILASHLFDKNMKLTKTKSTPESIVETGSKENRITYNNKDEKVALQVKPFMKLDINDFEEDVNQNYLGHYHMKLTEIDILVSYYLFDLTNIKMKPIHVKLEYLTQDLYSQVKDKLIDLVVRDYGINEIIDIDKTMEKFKPDELNYLRTNRYFIELQSDNSWYSKGKINQEIIIEFNRHSLEDLKDIKVINSSRLYDEIYSLYIDESNLDIKIDLDTNKITFKSPAEFLANYLIKNFVNDGPLKNFQKYKSVEVIKDHEVVGSHKNNILNVIDINKLDHLFDDIKKEDNAEQTNDQENVVDESEEELDDNSPEPASDKNPKVRKSSSLKYLWLLTIPFCLGIFCLITWLMPLIKRKK